MRAFILGWLGQINGEYHFNVKAIFYNFKHKWPPIKGGYRELNVIIWKGSFQAYCMPSKLEIAQLQWSSEEHIGAEE